VGGVNEHFPHITCPVCNMTSYHPEDVRQGYCGHCYTTTNGIVCTDKCVHKRLGAWEYNPIVNDWRGPTRPPVGKLTWLGVLGWLGLGIILVACVVAVLRGAL
jgi:hypothetical protein